MTPNHTGFEAGPNNFQNYPVLIGAVQGSSTEIVGTLNSLPNATYTLDFYDNSASDPSGFGQGEVYLGFATVTTDGSGNVRFDVTVSGASANGDIITATATDASGNTSEFSHFITDGLLVVNTSDSGPGSLRQAILDADADPGPNTILFSMHANDPNHFYYANDGIAGHVTQADITPTTAASDSSISNIDPDHPYSWWSIQVSSALPSITNATTIDGYSQPGASANTLGTGDNAVLRIEIDGANVSGLAPGLDVGNAPRFLVNDFAHSDVQVYNASTGAFLSSITSSNLNGGGDVIQGPDGKLYIGSFNNNNIERFDPVTGASLGVFASGNGLNGPAGFAFGPDGNLYVASYNNAEVLEYNGTTGAFIRTFVSGDPNLHHPYGMIFGPDGNLYVSDVFGNGAGGVLRYQGPGGANPGAFISTFVAAGSGGLFGPTGMAFGPDGNFYVASFGNAEVLRYDGTTGAFKDVFVSSGSGGLPRANALNFGPDGNLYVSSGDPFFGGTSSGVWRYNGQTGAFLDTFVPSGANSLAEADAELFLPPQVALNPSAPATIRGLVINRFGGPGVELESPGSNIVTGNFIGTDVIGTVGLGNGGGGVWTNNSAGNTLGGGTPNARNVISGNGTFNAPNGFPYQTTGLNDGVDVIGAGSNHNFIAGNYIGTNAAGTAAIGQINGSGVFLYGGAASTSSAPISTA